MEYFKKIDKNPYEDLYWNVPKEQKMGEVAVIGGNAQSFRTPIRAAEYLSKEFPLKTIRVVLPESLKSKLPPLPDAVFLKDAANGSFAETEGLLKVIDAVDFGLLVGDLSKNSVTGQKIAEVCEKVKKPLLVTRDAVDLLAGREKVLMNENLTLMDSLVQWQKIFKGVYYPKVLLTSQSLVQVAEAFHKFTLSYPVNVVTLHDGQILVAKNGNVVVVPLVKTTYSVLTIWNGDLAAKITAINLYNPEKFIEATVAAIF